jgi:transposase
MRRIQLKAHLSVEEIEKRYRASAEGVERSQWQIIWLLAQGKLSEEVEAVTGYGVQWIRTLARRYNAQGASGLGDKRHSNPGRPGPLSPAQQQALKTELTAARARGENWNGRRVAQWMSQRLGRSVHMQRGYECLAKLGLSAQVPRPPHKSANVEDQTVFKKSSPKPSR